MPLKASFWTWQIVVATQISLIKTSHISLLGVDRQGPHCLGKHWTSQQWEETVILLWERGHQMSEDTMLNAGHKGINER